MPTTTLYANANDGTVYSSNANLATARASAGFIDTTITSMLIGSYFSTGTSTYLLYEYFCQFDTSSIPTGATITALTFSLHGSDATTNPTTGTFDVYGYDWGGTLSLSSWRAGGSIASTYTKLASFTPSGWSNVAYNDFTNNGSNFYNYIVKGGTTRFMVVHSVVDSGTPDTNKTSYHNTGNATSGLQPKLVITYTNTYSQSVVGTMGTLSGTVTKIFARFGVNLNGAFTASASLAKNMAKIFTGSAGTVSGTVGTVSVKIVNLAGTMSSFSATLAKQFTRYGVNIAGNISSSATLAAAGRYTRFLIGTVSMTGSMGIFSTVRNAIMKAGSVVRTFMRGGNA